MNTSDLSSQYDDSLDNVQENIDQQQYNHMGLREYNGTRGLTQDVNIMTVNSQQTDVLDSAEVLEDVVLEDNDVMDLIQ